MGNSKQGAMGSIFLVLWLCLLDLTRVPVHLTTGDGHVMRTCYCLKWIYHTLHLTYALDIDVLMWIYVGVPDHLGASGGAVTVLYIP